jgi:hypothetical protein
MTGRGFLVNVHCAGRDERINLNGFDIWKGINNLYSCSLRLCPDLVEKEIKIKYAEDV